MREDQNLSNGPFPKNVWKSGKNEEIEEKREGSNWDWGE
jgi:hypothetical protein